MISVHISRRARLAATLATVVLVPVSLLPPAQASASVPDGRGAATTTTDCDPARHRAAVDAAMARLDRTNDQRRYTARQMRRIDAALDSALRQRGMGSGGGGFDLTLRIPVYAHVINNRRSEGPSRTRVLRQIDVLNRAYGGRQSTAGVNTRFRFYLAAIDRVRNPEWYTATMSDAADRRARRRLHRGGPDALNLYISRPRRTFGAVTLGWSSEPRRVTRYPRLDGVTIHKGSMPGGWIRNYNRGDTAVHEVGHWLGLFHTFEGGCSPRNDLVPDTPAEAGPALGCPVGRDSCVAPGDDPVRNFMDYSYDTCMNLFTAGQRARMTRNWLAYRTP